MPIFLVGVGHHSAFLIFLIPIILGIFMAKRYNFLMGLISVVFFGYLIPSIFNNVVEEAFLESLIQSTEGGLGEGIVTLSFIYGNYINEIFVEPLQNMNFNFTFLTEWGPLIILFLIFMIFLVPSAKLRKRRKRKRNKNFE